YPLGALFVVVATCAVLVAGVSPLIRSLFRGEVNMGDFFQTLAMGAGCGLVIGAAIGGWRFQPAQPALLGAAAGSVIGGAAGIVALLPVNQLAPAAAAMTAGCALIVGVALVMRPTE